MDPIESGKDSENINPRPRNKRRSSILKPPANTFRGVLQDINPNDNEKRVVMGEPKEPVPKAKSRRVSFSRVQTVKEFQSGSQTLTIWNNTYEEDHGNASSSINSTAPQKPDTNTTSNRPHTQPLQIVIPDATSPNKFLPTNPRQDTSDLFTQAPTVTNFLQSIGSGSQERLSSTDCEEDDSFLQALQQISDNPHSVTTHMSQSMQLSNSVLSSTSSGEPQKESLESNPAGAEDDLEDREEENDGAQGFTSRLDLTFAGGGLHDSAGSDLDMSEVASATAERTVHQTMGMELTMCPNTTIGASHANLDLVKDECGSGNSSFDGGQTATMKFSGLTLANNTLMLPSRNSKRDDDDDDDSGNIPVEIINYNADEPILKVPAKGNVTLHAPSDMDMTCAVPSEAVAAASPLQSQPYQQPEDVKIDKAGKNFGSHITSADIVDNGSSRSPNVGPEARENKTLAASFEMDMTQNVNRSPSPLSAAAFGTSGKGNRTVAATLEMDRTQNVNSGPSPKAANLCLVNRTVAAPFEMDMTQNVDHGASPPSENRRKYNKTLAESFDMTMTQNVGNILGGSKRQAEGARQFYPSTMRQPEVKVPVVGNAITNNKTIAAETDMDLTAADVNEERECEAGERPTVPSAQLPLHRGKENQYNATIFAEADMEITGKVPTNQLVSPHPAEEKLSLDGNNIHGPSRPGDGLGFCDNDMTKGKPIIDMELTEMERDESPFKNVMPGSHNLPGIDRLKAGYVDVKEGFLGTKPSAAPLGEEQNDSDTSIWKQMKHELGKNVDEVVSKVADDKRMEEEPNDLCLEKKEASRENVEEGGGDDVNYSPLPIPEQSMMVGLAPRARFNQGLFEGEEVTQFLPFTESTRRINFPIPPPPPPDCDAADVEAEPYVGVDNAEQVRIDVDKVGDDDNHDLLAAHQSKAEQSIMEKMCRSDKTLFEGLDVSRFVPDIESTRKINFPLNFPKTFTDNAEKENDAPESPFMAKDEFLAARHSSDNQLNAVDKQDDLKASPVASSSIYEAGHSLNSQGLGKHSYREMHPSPISSNDVGPMADETPPKIMKLDNDKTHKDHLPKDPSSSSDSFDCKLETARSMLTCSMHQRDVHLVDETTEKNRPESIHSTEGSNKRLHDEKEKESSETRITHTSPLLTDKIGVTDLNTISINVSKANEMPQENITEISPITKFESPAQSSYTNIEKTSNNVSFASNDAETLEPESKQIKSHLSHASSDQSATRTEMNPVKLDAFKAQPVEMSQCPVDFPLNDEPSIKNKSSGDFLTKTVHDQPTSEQEPDQFQGEGQGRDIVTVGTEDNRPAAEPEAGLALKNEKSAVAVEAPENNLKSKFAEELSKRKSIAYDIVNIFDDLKERQEFGTRMPSEDDWTLEEFSDERGHAMFSWMVHSLVLDITLGQKLERKKKRGERKVVDHYSITNIRLLSIHSIVDEKLDTAHLMVKRKFTNSSLLQQCPNTYGLSTLLKSISTYVSQSVRLYSSLEHVTTNYLADLKDHVLTIAYASPLLHIGFDVVINFSDGLVKAATGAKVNSVLPNVTLPESLLTVSKIVTPDPELATNIAKKMDEYIRLKEKSLAQRAISEDK